MCTATEGFSFSPTCLEVPRVSRSTSVEIGLHVTLTLVSRPGGGNTGNSVSQGLAIHGPQAGFGLYIWPMDVGLQQPLSPNQYKKKWQ